MSLLNKVLAEFVGTFWLVFAGCGSAVISFVLMGDGQSVNSGIGLLGVALAFGLAVMVMAFAVGHVSGGHFNPAVSTSLLVGGRFPASEFIPYVLAQVGGAIVAAALLYVVATGKEGFTIGGAPGTFAANGYGKEGSPAGYSMMAGAVVEFVMTFIFLTVILGATDPRAPSGFAPIAIRAVPDGDHFGRRPGHEPLGQPGAQHRTGPVCRRLGGPTAVVVLGGADRRCGGCRRRLPRRCR